MSDAITVTIPLRTVSSANAREHHMAKYRRTKKERAAAIAVPKVDPPCVVRLTRIAKAVGRRKWQLDDDNLRSAMKALRDGIAARLGVDDSPDSPIDWEYGQERGDVWAVRVEIFPQAADFSHGKSA